MTHSGVGHLALLQAQDERELAHGVRFLAPDFIEGLGMTYGGGSGWIPAFANDDGREEERVWCVILSAAKSVTFGPV